METDPTQPGFDGVTHPRIDQLKDATPDVQEHVASCEMCQQVSQNMGTLDLPKDLVTEAAFQWPGDPLARGGMAYIFEGNDRRLGRKVILKTPRDAAEVPPALARMFELRVAAEARILARLQHPSIVTIYELGKATTGSPFCVLERVDGRSLRDRLDEIAVDEAADDKRATRERLELVSNLVAVAEAMAYAHSRRVVHRDITPNNILLGRHGEATLIDWGIARDLDAAQLPDLAGLLDEAPSTSGRWQTINAGTPPYVPLEQTQGRTADPSFDVYSFGVTLYEVVSGKTPYQWKPDLANTNRLQQLHAFIKWLSSDEPIAPADPRDPELSGIIAKAMARDPKQRFTADELVIALKQYLTGDLVFSHRYSATGRLARWVRRHRAVTAAIGIAVVALIVVGFGWAQLARQRQEKAELAALAASAKVDAAEKTKEANDAEAQAKEALARAEEAERDGQDAKALRDRAIAKRKEAERIREEALAAEKRAKGDADDAIKQYRAAIAAQIEAERQRDVAIVAQADAERARDLARAAQATAEGERDTATADRMRALAAQNAAETAREAAQQAQVAAESERDAARAGQTRAEEEREAARRALVQAETDRDDARQKLAAAERKLNECQQRCTEPPPEPPPPQ
jgi:tRNA A-37 threonylcarbamoyl transferase component Bud32